MHDLIRRLKQQAYGSADRDQIDVEQTAEWIAVTEIEAWRSVMPQYEFRDGAIHRKPESLPPFSRPASN